VAGSVDGVLPRIFAASFGALLGISLLKFGNPVVLDKYVVSPSGTFEVAIEAWPVAWGYCLLGAVLLLGLFTARWNSRLPRMLTLLPLAWLVWEFLAGMGTIDQTLTRVTVIHFASCVACFYLGAFALARVQRMGLFWTGLIVGFALVQVSGFMQHFGGLAETRRYVAMYSDLSSIPPEFQARLASDRIFATLFYANTLAGVILLLLPVTLAVLMSLKTRLTAPARWFLVSVAAATALVCLYWSGSKGGWLLLLLLGLVATRFLPIPRPVKLMLISGVLLLGLAGFIAKYAGFFEKGATSVVARYVYWKVAAQIAANHPVFGIGPGTFGIAYELAKPPGAEMARLVHNDYLEQACDSGIPGMLFYSAFVIGGLWWVFRTLSVNAGITVRAGVWIGLVGWATHSSMEFHLYIPAVAWPAFTVLGWLAGTAPPRVPTMGANASTEPAPPATLQNA
jgi:O-antigen ligase